MVILNDLIFFALGAIGNHVLGIIFLVPVTLFYLVFSSIPQLLVRRFIEKRHFLKPLPRTLAYLSPLALLFLLGLVLPASARAPNKQNPALSPDGQFEAHFSSPASGWDVVVVDRKSGRKHKEEAPFMPHLQIYWHWDADNRLWIYNSDDGSVHLLNRDRDKWLMSRWGYGHRTDSDPGVPPGLTPPAELYPPYATTDRD